jgi:acetylornithine deacetylase/succinyl-diaminopimelate desuccinylase-like protein
VTTDGISAASVCQRLVQFDTTNPPGRERACVEWIERYLEAHGLEPRRIARNRERPNLVARWPGAGRAPPLLLYGHVDVVPVDRDAWRHPPFEGVIRDGWLWGRGTLDMKGGVAMLLAAVARARERGVVPEGDILLAVVVDEEAGGDDGARFLTETCPGLFNGVRWAVGEFGGFPLHLGGQRFYPVQVAEKGLCWMEARVKGRGGHGSFPRRGGTMAALARLLEALDRRNPPHRVTPGARRMVEAMAERADPPLDATLEALLDPERMEETARALGPAGTLFQGALQNTANATVVRSGDKTNVVPGEARVKIDGRPLPSVSRDEMLAEIRAAVGREVELEVLRHEPGTAAADLGLLPLLEGLLREADPHARPFPLVLLGGTDARFFSRLGIQTYGFLPLDLPEDFAFLETIHAPDERVPVDALEFGTEILVRLLERYRTP